VFRWGTNLRKYVKYTCKRIKEGINLAFVLKIWGALMTELLSVSANAPTDPETAPAFL